MDTVLEPFLIGLAVGLVVTIIVYISSMLRTSKLKSEINYLKKHLHQKMDIDAEASEARKKEIDRLKAENENLRITNQALAQKPGRREVINFHVYQKAVDLMMETAVGFAPMWQKTLRQAKDEYDKAIDSGKSSFVKKILPINFFGSEPPTSEENKEGE